MTWFDKDILHDITFGLIPREQKKGPPMESSMSPTELKLARDLRAISNEAKRLRLDVERERMHVDIKLLDPRAEAPTYATSGAAGVDVRACIDKAVVLHPGKTELIPLGFSMAVPPGFTALLVPRSGLGHKSGVVLGNLVGLLDEDYRGGVAASVWNRKHDGMPFLISPGDRIAQMVIVPVLRPEYRVVKCLPSTARGAGGFGSTGV